MSLPVTPTLDREFDIPADASDPAYSPISSPGEEKANRKLTPMYTRSIYFTLAPGENFRSQIAIAALQLPSIEPTFKPSDATIPDNYVTHTIQRQKWLEPVTWRTLIWNIQWISFIVITVTPILAVYGLFTTELNRKTFIWR